VDPVDTAAPPRPVAGARIRVLEVTSGRIFESGRTDEGGAYALTELPAGEYSLTVQTDRGVYLSDGLVSLAAGDDRRVSFALQNASSEGEGDEGEEAEPGEGSENKGQGKGKGKGKRKGFSWADHPWIAGTVVAGTAIALGVLVDDLTDEEDQEERKASPSTPE
jgi:hypothetical protein